MPSIFGFPFTIVNLWIQIQWLFLISASEGLDCRCLNQLSQYSINFTIVGNMVNFFRPFIWYFLHHHIHLKLFISTMFFYRHITSLLPEIVMPHDCSYYCFLKKKIPCHFLEVLECHGENACVMKLMVLNWFVLSKAVNGSIVSCEQWESPGLYLSGTAWPYFTGAILILQSFLGLCWMW